MDDFPCLPQGGNLTVQRYHPADVEFYHVVPLVKCGRFRMSAVQFPEQPRISHDPLRQHHPRTAGFPADTINCNSELSEESSDRIELTHYSPKELRYAFSTDTERAAIFSEIYYPKGWKAWIEPAGAYGEVRDGHYHPTAEAREIELFRADWMLRGAIIPGGEGQLIMRFEPESYQLGENISRASSIVLILLLIGSAAGMILTSRNKRQ